MGESGAAFDLDGSEDAAGSSGVSLRMTYDEEVCIDRSTPNISSPYVSRGD